MARGHAVRLGLWGGWDSNPLSVRHLLYRQARLSYVGATPGGALPAHTVPPAGFEPAASSFSTKCLCPLDYGGGVRLPGFEPGTSTS